MLDYAITIRDLLYVGAAGLALLIVFCLYALREFIKELFDVALHRYIWTGEALTMQHGDDPKTQTICQHVRIDGWGAYAAVLLNVGAIRRDQIRKDENGNWFYRYGD
jgi:hypothetical protein